MKDDRVGPRYAEVGTVLGDEIRAMAPNSLLPTEEQLARRFGVSRVTIRHALGLIERSGAITRLRGRGTIVSPPKVTRHLARTIERDLREQGVKLETRLVGYSPAVSPPEAVRQRLRLPPQASAGCLELIRVVDDLIICHDLRYFAPALARRFSPVLLQNQSLSEILRDLGRMRITTADFETEIVPSSRSVAKLLGVTPGTLVAVNTFTEYFENGTPSETGTMSYRIDRVRFKVVQAGASLER
jgi:GntR family transcriptional regulator